jgi:HK97 family phage major capsid protein
MALTLAEAAKLSNDLVLAGIIETAVKVSPVLQVMPFVEITGNSLKYNRENALAAAGFFPVGGTWTESTPTFTQVSSALVILGGDADVDNYVRQTRSNVQDIEAAVIELKAKAVAQTFEDTFIYGSVALDANAFDGLQVLCPSGQQVHQGSGSTGAALSLANLDAMIDLVKPGKPDLLLMSRRTRRGLSAFARANNSPVEYAVNAFGQQVAFYNGIPIGVSDYQLDTEAIASGAYSAKTGGATSSVWALRFGEDGLAGLTNGGLQRETVGALETKDAMRTRIKWYVGLALFATLSIAKIDGISAAAVVA